MVQIIDENRPMKSSDRFAQAFGNFGQSLAQDVPEYLMGQQREREELDAADRMGWDLRGFSPETRKTAFSELFKATGKQLGEMGDRESDIRDYTAIKDRFGEEAADLYLAAPVGGKTAIINKLLEDESRNTPARRAGIIEEDENKDEEKPGFKTKDFDKGLTPKERARAQETRYKTNLPLYQESQEKRQFLDQETDLLDILEELSPQISFSERLNINPSSGDLLVPALASPEAQRYVKTINEFSRGAKDTYGARVTNFDLTQFMKRLPGLANSEEGRRQIIQQMKIINAINRTYQDSLSSVVDSYGGIRNIDWDQAQRTAEKQAKGKIGSLKKEFRNIGNKVDKIYQEEIKELKRRTPNGYVLVEEPNGETSYIPKENLNDFLKENIENKAL